jgi:YrbI family 3-deoxy-D-manno-octulosonate 8-phosphate phosphatase
MTIGFIPIRSGSKSIPNKNIKLINGKPLVYWSAQALQNAKSVDKIVIATDSDKYESVVKAFGMSKLDVFRRSKDSSTDTSSTEDVVLEYLEQSRHADNDTFILVQATSPLTNSSHIEEALQILRSGSKDGIVTGVNTKRFFWDTDGTPKNYDFMSRPRRQDFDGIFMENGAFYISKVGLIKESKNRISGKIGLYEMPEYTAAEIDEPDDWVVIEKLLSKYSDNTIPSVDIKIVLTDVDGSLTDAGMYYSENGDEIKKFSTRDGKGFQLLREAGIKTGIITSETTKIVEDRAKKLKVDYLFQGLEHNGKVKAAKDICEKEDVSLGNIAYFGDDINCVELLSIVGIAGCPKDAVDEVKSLHQIQIMDSCGGRGAFRDFANSILTNRV